MEQMWMIQGVFCQGYIGLGIGFAPIEGAVPIVRRVATPVTFSGAFWHVGHEPINPLIGQMNDMFGDSELHDIEFLDGDEFFFHKRYRTRPGEPLRDQVVYRLNKEATGPWWSGEYVVDSKPKSFRGPARCIITEVTLDPIQADIDKFAKDHGFQDPQRVKV